MKHRDDNLYNRKGIYGIKNTINNKIYIGQTTKNFGDRRDCHYSSLKNNKHMNQHLQKAWNKYGEENFDFIIIHDLQENEDINELEKYYIKYYKDLDLSYNISDGGEYGFAYKTHLSEETKRKIGNKNRINMIGKKASDDTKAKMSKTHKKRISLLTEKEKQERVRPMIEANKGRKWTEEQRQNYIEQQKIKPHGAKYTVEDVKRIRFLHEEKKLGYTEISELTGIQRHTVYQIATYKRWKNVV